MIILTYITGDTLTLSEDGDWSSTQPALLEIGQSTRLSIDDEWKADPILELAKTVVAEWPGFTLEERDRPADEEDDEEVVY